MAGRAPLGRETADLTSCASNSRVSPSRLLLACVLTIAALAQQPLPHPGPTAEPASPPAMMQLSELQREAIGAGSTILLADGSAVASVWVRNQVGLGNTSRVAGLHYPRIRPSALIGFIAFPNSTADFDGNPIPPGFYSMRYELWHGREVAMLAPADADRYPSQDFTLNALATFSGTISPTGRPVTLPLLPPPPASTFEATVAAARNAVVFTAVTRSFRNELFPMSILVPVRRVLPRVRPSAGVRQP